MKKTILIIAAFATGLVSFGQSQLGNVDLGVFNNGTNGSNGANGANLEFALRIKPASSNGYTAVPAAEDFLFYIRLPKTDFAETDVVNIVQTNTSIFGATGTMLFQGIFDLGDPLYLYGGLALNAAAGMNLSSLSAVTHAWSFAYTINFTPAKTPAQYSQLVPVDQTNNAFISTVFGAPTFTALLMSGGNQLTGAAIIALPVDLLSFSGYRDGSRNQLRWTTATEQNNKGFEVLRSLDGVNYTPIAFVNSLAPGGSSSIELHYSYADNSVTGLRQYYRLRQVDFDGHNKLSNIVLLKSDKPVLITIEGVFPNPATTTINMLVGSPVKDKINVVVIDMSGKIMLTKSMNVETGSNTLPLDISALAGGNYMVKMISSDGEVATAKFVKQ